MHAKCQQNNRSPNANMIDLSNRKIIKQYSNRKMIKHINVPPVIREANTSLAILYPFQFLARCQENIAENWKSITG